MGHGLFERVIGLQSLLLVCLPRLARHHKEVGGGCRIHGRTQVGGKHISLRCLTSLPVAFVIIARQLYDKKGVEGVERIGNAQPSEMEEGVIGARTCTQGTYLEGLGSLNLRVGHLVLCLRRKLHVACRRVQAATRYISKHNGHMSSCATVDTQERGRSVRKRPSAIENTQEFKHD